jgi:hypothetical protein
MIKNSNEILTQNLEKAECILKEFMKNVLNQEQEGKLTINTIEKTLGIMITALIQIGLGMAGAILSNMVVEKIDMYCSCGKKMVYTKRNALTRILSMFGYIPVTRDELFCRRCHKGRGVTDKMLEIYGEHRITKGMTEIITYIGQIMSFERASEHIKKLLKIEISGTQIQIISEGIGEQVFEEDKNAAKKAYEKPEEAAPQELPMYRREGRLYIFTDGLQVNTRVEDKDGSTWREMKLGLIFCDKDTIKRADGSGIITKKEYISYFGNVNEFKKFLFAAACRAGYGKIKEVVLIGDGAAWIWNMTEELFPDAVKILDYYHLSENVNDYAKFIYPQDEVTRKIWAKKVLDAVMEGKVEEAMKIVEEKNVDKTPKGIVNLYTYMANNRDRINYKEFKDKGYYIGSGAIEGANKTVIQHRMNQAGMRWGISGGQYIAALRAKFESGLWSNVEATITA